MVLAFGEESEKNNLGGYEKRKDFGQNSAITNVATIQTDIQKKCLPIDPEIVPEKRTIKKKFATCTL